MILGLRADFGSERADFGSERADFRSERADFRSRRTNFEPGKADFRSKRDDFRPERANSVPERVNFRPLLAGLGFQASGGGLWKDRRTEGWRDVWKFIHVFYRTSALWGRCPKRNRVGKLGRIWVFGDVMMLECCG